MVRITLSRKLGELRVTQSELAKVTGIRPNTISELYRAFAERVSLEQLDKICEALGCDLSEILEFTPNALQTVAKCKGKPVYGKKV